MSRYCPPPSGKTIVNRPELDRATARSLEADDHEQLLPVLGAEVVLRDLPPTLHPTLNHEVVALPMGLDLEVAAAVHFLHQLPAVRVQQQRLAVLPGEGHRGIGLLQGEGT